MTEGEKDRVGFRDVLALPQVRAIWVAQLLSVLGDQVARVALTVLVFGRTGSAALTALTYALTFLPDLVAGPLLSGLADRYPRRAVMVVTDLARAVLVGAMAVPGTPLPVLATLLVAVQLLGAPFNAGRAAILPHVASGEHYVVASALIGTTYQSAQVLGFALGGPLVAAVGVSPALAVDAGTFVVSAALLRLGVAEQRAHGTTRAPAARLGAGTRVVWGDDRRLRLLVALACVSAFVVTVEGLAAPYAAALGAGPAAVGVLLAANPLGAVVGILVVTRLVAPAVRVRLLGVLAIASCAPLIASALDPGLGVLVVLWTASGVACAYQVPANALFVASVPDEHRGQAFGLALTALRVAQGIGVLVSGLVAESSGPATAVASSGVIGLTVAGVLAVAWARLLAREHGIPGT